MKIEDHARNIKESLDVINESIQKGILERQRNIGFNTSVAATEMLEVFLHKLNLINPGLSIKHDLFNSIKKADEKLKFDFPHKKEIIELIHEIESKKNLLCYGKPQPIQTIESVIHSFNRLKEILKKEGLSWD
jgi:hypothetical protein